MIKLTLEDTEANIVITKAFQKETTWLDIAENLIYLLRGLTFVIPGSASEYAAAWEQVKNENFIKPDDNDEENEGNARW